MSVADVVWIEVGHVGVPQQEQGMVQGLARPQGNQAFREHTALLRNQNMWILCLSPCQFCSELVLDRLRVSQSLLWKALLVCRSTS